MRNQPGVLATGSETGATTRSLYELYATTGDLENLPARKAAGVRGAMETAGASRMFLPPYSPDFNPIENAFAKLKACRGQRPEQTSPHSGTSSAPSSNFFTLIECAISMGLRSGE